MRPERVVIINDESVESGGAAALALLSAKLLAAAGVPLSFVTGDSGGTLPSNGDFGEIVALHSAPLMKLPWWERATTGMYNAAAHQALARYIVRHDTPGTIYHVHAWAQILSPSIFSALRPVEDRLVISAHDFTLACPNGSYADFATHSACQLRPLSARCLTSNCDKRRYADKIWRSARSWLRKQLIDLSRSSATVVSIHPMMNPWLERGGIAPERIRTILNPVQPFSKQRVTAENNHEIIFIGRVEYEKGVDLAAAAARLTGRRLRIIGDGSFGPEFRRRYPEALWEGWRTHEEISALLGQARAVVMPSRLPEPFGLVAHECLQSGIPLVAFPTAFVAAEAAKLGCAVVAKRPTVPDLAAALQALDSDDAVAQMSRSAFSFAPSLSNSPDRWCAELVELYGRCLSAAPMARSLVH
jgi:glycosyltransferase involved in cell wall biosynthesis